MTFKTLKPTTVDPNQMQSGNSHITVKSPCVSVCVLNEEDICVGCYRTGEEISRWGSLDNASKREILASCQTRARKLNPFL